jgi:hypothetical protein
MRIEQEEIPYRSYKITMSLEDFAVIMEDPDKFDNSVNALSEGDLEAWVLDGDPDEGISYIDIYATTDEEYDYMSKKVFNFVKRYCSHK